MTVSTSEKELLEQIGKPTRTVDGGYGCPVCEQTYPDTKNVGVHLRTHWISGLGVAFDDVPNGKDRVSCPYCAFRCKRGGLSSHLERKHGTERQVALGFCRTYGFDLAAYRGAGQAPPPPVDYSAPYPGNRPKKARLADMTPAEQEEARTYWRWESARKRAVAAAGGEGPPAKRRGRPPGSKNAVRHLPAVIEQPTAARGIDGLIDPTDAALAVIMSQVNGHGVPAELLPDVIHYVDHTRELVGKLRSS